MNRVAWVAIVLVCSILLVGCRGLEQQKENVVRQLGSAAVRSLVRLTSKGSPKPDVRPRSSIPENRQRSPESSPHAECDEAPQLLVTRGRLPMDAAPGVRAPQNDQVLILTAGALSGIERRVENARRLARLVKPSTFRLDAVIPVAPVAVVEASGPHPTEIRAPDPTGCSQSSAAAVREMEHVVSVLLISG